MKLSEEKQKAIAEIEKKQHELLSKSYRIVRMKEPKKLATKLARALKSYELVIEAGSLETQRKIVLAQPLPKFEKGGVSG